MILPEGWRKIKFNECVTEQPKYGANAPSVDYHINLPRYVRITDITFDNSLTNDPVSINIEDAENYYLEHNDLLIARTGNTVGKSFLYKRNFGKCAYAGYLIKFKLDCNICDPDFIKYFTQSPRYWLWIKNTIRSGAQPNINAKEYLGVSLNLPPLIEQNKIVRLLSTWDKAIEKLEKLIELKKKRKKALEQQLLTGKKCFKEFKDFEWKTFKFSEFLKFNPREVDKPNTSYDALGIRSHGKGVFHKRVENPESVAMDKLYNVKENDLIINITFAWEGAVAIISKNDEDRLVSHRFPTYVFNSKICLSEYFRQIIITKWFVYKMGLISPGGAGRNRVLSKKDFLRLKIKLPTIQEQQKVSSLFNNIDKDIEINESKLEKIKQQKKGLMQQLLTGKKRVKFDDQG